jgi:hypothetical protein
MSDLLGFTAGRPPVWDVERFLRGDEVETALITLERNGARSPGGAQRSTLKA